MKKTLIYVISSVILFALIFQTSCSVLKYDNMKMEALAYSNDYVKTLEERGLSDRKFMTRGNGGSTYETNDGFEGSGVVVSPYFTLKINNRETPVYSTVVYSGFSAGALHDFAVIYVDNESIQSGLDIKVSAKDINLRSARILPEKMNTNADVDGNVISSEIYNYGIYTYMINDRQNNFLTLFLREFNDEDAEIQKYKEEYGEENVYVYEPGVYNIDYIEIPSDNYVLYLKRGAYLLANHKFDIDTEEDRTSNETVEEGAIEGTGGLNARFAFITCNNKTNVKITGSGTIDLTQLDWHERNGIYLLNSNKIELNGVTIINSAEWSVTTYKSSEISISDTVILGYKVNSDGINICNSQNVTVENCYVRSGDDSFSVKTLGATGNNVNSENIVFHGCQTMNTKARAFGITGEVEKDINNVLFKDCSILYRTATWDNDRIGGLVVIVENGKGQIDGVTFEDIEIYKDMGRAFNVTIYGNDIQNCSVQNIVFKNIKYSSLMPSQLKNRFNNDNNSISAEFSNVISDGILINQDNVNNYVFADKYSTLNFNNN